MESHEGCDTSRPELPQLPILGDLFLLVVNHLLAEMVPGVLQLGNHEIVDWIEIVLHLLVVFRVQIDQDYWEY